MNYPEKVRRSASRMALGATLYIGIVMIQAIILKYLVMFAISAHGVSIRQNENRIWIQTRSDNSWNFLTSLIAFIVWNNVVSHLHKIVYGALELLAGDELQEK